MRTWLLEEKQKGLKAEDAVEVGLAGKNKTTPNQIAL